jgi:hypothetical protein
LRRSVLRQIINPEPPVRLRSGRHIQRGQRLLHEVCYEVGAEERGHESA